MNKLFFKEELEEQIKKINDVRNDIILFVLKNNISFNGVIIKEITLQQTDIGGETKIDKIVIANNTYDKYIKQDEPENLITTESIELTNQEKSMKEETTCFDNNKLQEIINKNNDILFNVDNNKFNIDNVDIKDLQNNNNGSEKKVKEPNYKKVLRAIKGMLGSK